MKLSELCKAVDAATPQGFYTTIRVGRIRDDRDITNVRFEWEIYVCNYIGGLRPSAPYHRVVGDTIIQAYRLFMAQTAPWIEAQLGKVDQTDQAALVDVGEFQVPPGEDEITPTAHE